MAAQIQLKFTKQQIEMIVFELKQSVRGDNDPYDRKLKTIIKKLEGEL